MTPRAPISLPPCGLGLGSLGWWGVSFRPRQPTCQLQLLQLFGQYLSDMFPGSFTRYSTEHAPNSLSQFLRHLMHHVPWSADCTRKWNKLRKWVSIKTKPLGREIGHT